MSDIALVSIIVLAFIISGLIPMTFESELKSQWNKNKKYSRIDLSELLNKFYAIIFPCTFYLLIIIYLFSELL